MRSTDPTDVPPYFWTTSIVGTLATDDEARQDLLMAGTESGDELDLLVVISTFPDRERALAVARTLVEEGLVACVNVLPDVRSVYRFEGKIHDEPEVLCLAKTTRAGEPRLRQRLIALHPYQIPEVVAVAVVAGHRPYLDWVAACVQRG